MLDNCMPDLANPFNPTQTEKERQTDLERLKSLIERAKQNQSETRSTDPISGGQKGVKLQRFSLIPAEFLWALAEHYGIGAKKYTRYRECSCARIVKNLELLIQDNAAVPVTKSGFGRIIQNMLNAKGITGRIGEPETLKRLNSWDAVMEADRNPSESGLRTVMALAWRSTIQSYPDLAAFAENQISLDILIMTMKQVALEGRSVMDAISGLDSLKSVGGIGHTEHWPGCQALRVAESGDRNWERGYAWSKSIDALERHLALWKMGEWIDPETGSSHMIAVAWHAIALFIYKLRGLGTDDITPKKSDYNQYASYAGVGPTLKTTGYIAPPGIPVPNHPYDKDWDNPFQDKPISNNNPKSR